MHLTATALVDLLDGTTDPSSIRHLAACEVCRERLQALQDTASRVADVDVPEPSPLFWDHLSARVRAAVAAESVSSSWWHGGWWRVATVSTAIVVAIGVVVGVQRGPRPASTPHVNSQPAIAASVAEDGSVDASLRFVSDLAADVDLDAALDAGLVPQGGAERALTQMDQRDRVALRRLLSEALANGGA